MQDFNDKINQVYQSIFSETKKRLDLLLSLCESPIEKLFLINIFAHYYYLSLGLVKMEFITRALTTHEQSEGNLLKGNTMKKSLIGRILYRAYESEAFILQRLCQ